MSSFFSVLRRQWLEAILAAALGALCLQMHRAEAPSVSGSAEMVLHAERGRADMSLRGNDFPNTFIHSIHLDLASPHHWVRLTWAGPNAGAQEMGPFHSSPGRGHGTNDCNDPAESNRVGSKCTPKGAMLVQGFHDFMPSLPPCKFVTWFHRPRAIGFHSHLEVPDHPASRGCVRLSERAAQLIHNNAIVGRTRVIVDGTWTSSPITGESR